MKQTRRPWPYGLVLSLATLVLGVSGGALAEKGGNGGTHGGGGGGGKGGGKGNHGGGGTPALHLEGSGDSIMRAQNASCTSNTGLFDWLCYGGGEQLQNSFFDGSSSSVVSMLDRYLIIDASATAAQGAAAIGSEMTDPSKNNFANQAAQIAASATGPVQVVVELGGNDLCNRGTVAELYDDATWQQAVDDGLDVLVNGLPDGSTVFFSSVPRVQDLRAAGIELQNSRNNVDCEAFWSTFDVCRIATKDDSALSAIGERQQRYNEIVSERAQSYNSQASSTGVEVVSDYQGESVSSVGTYSFGAQEINGGDCFHPSLEGQSKLSEILFGNDPFK